MGPLLALGRRAFRLGGTGAGCLWLMLGCVSILGGVVSTMIRCIEVGKIRPVVFTNG